MHKKRLIARLDIKNSFVIKGIHLEGLRKIGEPNAMALEYYNQGIDELIFMDAVAAYYDRNSLFHIIEAACRDIFVPITVGGGIRTLDDIHQALESGADKVAINTQAIANPPFIKEAAQTFGSQCIVASIVAKSSTPGHWEVYIENGREPTGRDALEWAKELEALGVGEIMLTSLDQEGTKKGYDITLYEVVRPTLSVPLIACGGAGCHEHLTQLCDAVDVDALGAASLFHYGLAGIAETKEALAASGIEVRR